MWLSLETSSPLGSWAVGNGQEVTLHRSFSGRASSALFPSLAEAAQEVRQADTIFIGVGPGSFSAIRVAIAAAQGIALETGASLVPVLSSDAIAHDFPDEEHLGVFTPGRKGEYFLTSYKKGVQTNAPRLVAQARLEQELSLYTLGTTAEDIPHIGHRHTPSATSLALAALIKKPLPTLPTLPLEPVYLSPPVFTSP